MKKISKELRTLILKLSHRCKDGNIQSAFSCLEIIWALYDKVMNWSPEMATDENRDYFLVSKGQAVLALYAVLMKKNFFSEEVLNEIGDFDSKYSNQADVTKFKGGIENSAGSLGHGLPLAVGIAFGKKIKKLKSRIFVITGDGEFNEGTMWESCIFAAGKKLDNLCVIVDDNNSVGAMIDMGDMRKKFESFGFEVYDVDGHNLSELNNVLSIKPKQGIPMAVLAHTVRGYGCKTIMTESIWFHKFPNEEELDMLIKEVEAV